jgi:hypothetical protein
MVISMVAAKEVAMQILQNRTAGATLLTTSKTHKLCLAVHMPTTHDWHGVTNDHAHYSTYYNCQHLTNTPCRATQ